MMRIMRRRRRRLWAAVGISAAWATVAAFSGPTATAVALPASQPVAVVALSTPARAPQGKVVIRPLTILRAPGQVGVVIAHRGDSLATPENTMPAFLSSISRGANYLELDVRLSKDGVPVVIHDRTVDRTTDGTGAVSQLTAAQLRALDAGSWFSDSYASTRIPTLAEVLDLVSGTRVSAVIEYKGDWNVAAIRTTVDMIDEAGLSATVVVQSFSEQTVARIARIAPELKLALLSEGLDASTVATARSLGADAVNPCDATAPGVALAHEAGLGVFVWTRDAVAEWEALTAMGVDGIITNRPDALRAWVDTRAQR